MLRVNPKGFWSFLSDKKEIRDLPSVMQLDEDTSSDEREISNLFAKNFVSAYSSEIIVPPQIDYDHHVQIDHNNVLFSEDSVYKALSKLSGRAASGVDEISSFYIKKCSLHLSKPLTLLFNRSLQSGEFPDRWKVALIKPIYKSGSKNSIKNYRPVSIISIIPKLFEKLVYDRINVILNPLIIDKQFGFMKQRSTVTNLTSFHHFVTNALHTGCQVDCVYTDFSRAFDRVNHNMLISKLFALGVSGYLLKWIHSFLSGRVQIVKVGNALSEPINVSSGCIQGGHMSGLLFLLFINDIADIIPPDVGYWLFADDLKFAVRVRGGEDVALVQEVLSRLYHWCSSNFMELNIKKCSIMTYHRKKSPLLATYNINGEVLARREKVSDLGVTFEKDLRFVTHIQNVRAKASRMLGFITRNTKDFSNVSTLRTLYFAYVRSVLEYCSVVWSPQYQVHIKSLESIQHKFLRLIAFKSNTRIENHDYAEIESANNIMALETRRQINDLVFLYKLINNKHFCPDLLSQINIKVPTRETRNKVLFGLKKYKTNIDNNAPLQRSQRYWNMASDGGVDIFSDSVLNIIRLVESHILPFH
ncbi:hypothetical protein M8J77_003777 [Diaphorina citri]|nr:hypothetical protein M8J77_003777 [Diaphorina citri]